MFIKGLFTWRQGAPANRATRLEGLKHSPPLHATHLTGTVSGLRGQSFEQSLSKRNRMAYKNNFLMAGLMFVSLIPLATAFQCLGLLFCILLPCLSMFSRLKCTYPLILFRSKKYSRPGEYLSEKKFWTWSNPSIIVPRRSTENRIKITAILTHDRVSRIKSLATNVTSLREPNNLYFAPFCTDHWLFGRFDRYWSQIYCRMI